jgi:two-component system sensor histidine kinase ChvG
VVVVMPVLWIWLAGANEASSIASMRTELAQAAMEARDAPEQAESIADAHRVRLRVLKHDAVVLDLDRAPEERWHHPVSDPFFGPEGRPDFRAFDTTQPPLAERPEVIRARDAGVGMHCMVSAHGLLLVCSAAATLEDGRTIHVQRGSARLIRSLYEVRHRLGAVTAVMLLVGGALALWLGRRMVRPLEVLQEQVLSRTSPTVSTAPLDVDSDDEFGALAGAFNQLLAALEARNKANASFMADLAHELKNPVAAVRAAADALDSPRPVTDERKARLQRVLADSSGRMGVVIDRFLELARAEAGLIGTERDAVALHELLAAVVEPLASDPRFAHVTFSVHAEPAFVAAAAERLETALRNLAVNAASFAASTVDLSLSSQDGKATLMVTDDGPGIREEHLDKIFGRYFTTRGTGTGLGLALAHAVVHAHGGDIEVSSVYGEGACFLVRLPLALHGQEEQSA